MSKARSKRSSVSPSLAAAIGRVTDHRINLTLHRLPQIIAGELDAVIEPLRSEHQADLLSALGLDQNGDG